MTDEELPGVGVPVAESSSRPVPELAALVAHVGAVEAADRVERGNVGEQARSSRTEARRDDRLCG